MHFIQSQTHLGTHVEAPNKYDEDGADVGSMPLDTYIGAAAACDFSGKAPGSPITAEDLREAGAPEPLIVSTCHRRYVQSQAIIMSLRARMA